MRRVIKKKKTNKLKNRPCLGAHGLPGRDVSRLAVPVTLIKDPICFQASLRVLHSTQSQGSFLGSCLFTVHTWDDYVYSMVSSDAAA